LEASCFRFAVPFLSVELVFIRHAQPEWVANGLCVIDPRLSELGFEQAEILGKSSVGDETFDEVLVSPLLRARQTAAPLAQRLGMEPEIDDWLEECREPQWHGEPALVAHEAYKAEARQSPAERWGGLPGGESARDFQARIQSGVDGFLAARGARRLDHELPIYDIKDPGKRIAMVAHAGTNAVALTYLLGVPSVPWEWDRFRLGHSSVTRVHAKPVGDHFTFNLYELSNLEHLAKDMRTY
jgi:2,3-bisphosphoglycerate-dependent phosphoglycerate mutase